MWAFRWYVLPVVLAIASIADAQQQGQRDPHIGYIYPAGARQGTTVDVTVGGQFLEGVSDARMWGPGVKATIVEYVRPMTQMQAMQLREQIQALQEKRSVAMAEAGNRGASPSTQPWTADDEKALIEARAKLSTFVRKPSSPAIFETVTVRITVAADAEPGQRELRFLTPGGLTNPLTFCVGQLPEFVQKVTKSAAEPTASVPREEMTVTLPATLNGQIMAGGVDRYHFQARRGQHLVVVATARALIPYLPDAVPGWFQATLALYDDTGKELAYDDDFRFNPDPVLHYLVPRDGQYTIEIKDAIYRGREDFVYRIAVGELPFITGIYPLGGRTATQTNVELRGWNLPVSRVMMDAMEKDPGNYPITAHRAGFNSNTEPFMVDTLPELADKEPNNQPQNAQQVTLPIIVNGRIDKSDDCDVFSFTGRAGDQIVAEVYARRLNSPMDSMLRLTDATGKQLAFNDDHEDKSAAMITHHADSYLNFTLPTDGTYYVHLTDAQHKGGSEYAYRLRISAPRPDFDLRIVPSSISIRPGATVPITVYALRKDGFSGDIAFSLKDIPNGFALSGARVPPNQDRVRMTLTAPPPGTPLAEQMSLHIDGRATIAGQDVIRPAVPAEDMMQAFSYHHLVPAKELVAALAGRLVWRNPARIVDSTPLRIPVNGVARFRVWVPVNNAFGPVKLELSDPPDGFTIRSTSPLPMPGRIEIVFEAKGEKLNAGAEGNLIVEAFATRLAAAANARGNPNAQRVLLGTLLAIPYQVVNNDGVADAK